MTAETLIEKVRDKLGALDRNGEQIVTAAMEILNDKSSSLSSNNGFVGQNVTLEEYEALSPDEKSRYLEEAETLNRRWIENQYKTFDANWIMVVDGRVVLSGMSLKDYPEHEDFLKICETTGKYPFVFISAQLLAIEERSTNWHDTFEAGDAYPAVPIALSHNENRFVTDADLDTGALDCYGALELLAAQGIIEIERSETRLPSQHLSRKYFYYIKRILVELAGETGENRRCHTTVVCVDNWRNSPFTAINPTRTFLLGRGVLLELRPRLLLDFDARQTEIQFSGASNPAQS